MSENTETAMPAKTPDDFSFLDAEVQDCPYEAYQALREQAPVYRDPHTGQYLVTRFEDLRRVLTDQEHFGNTGRPETEIAPPPEPSERERRLLQLYEEMNGWLPEGTIYQREGENHRQLRSMFDKAFRPGRIRQLDPFVEATANRLFDAFAEEGACEWVGQFAVPLPLIVIAHQLGMPEEDIGIIKKTTDAWVRRSSGTLSEEEEREALAIEIDLQHYLKEVFDRLRAEPNDTVFSDLVNTEIPEWGRTLTDGELQAEMMISMFIGGSETSTNAMAEGVRILIEQPHVWAKLKSDPDTYLRTFVEEVLRLEAPVQALSRTALTDVEMHGVTIPAGAAHRHALRGGEPRRAALRAPGRGRPRPRAPDGAPDVRGGHPPLPGGAPRAPRALLRLQDAGRARRRAALRRGEERLPAPSAPVPAGAEGVARRVHAGLVAGAWASPRRPATRWGTLHATPVVSG